jgi:pimeloyl-ACP methyl ester carboxylesterase
MPTIIARDGERLYYRSLGSGPCVMLLHGFGMHSGHWLPFATYLSRKFTVILPDLRGFGRSHHSMFNQQCTVSNFAEDMEDLCKYLGLNAVKLAGISMGALTALKYFEKYGTKRISAYLHIDQSPCCANNESWQWGLFGSDHDIRIQRGERLMQALQPFIENNTRYENLPKALRDQLQHEFGEFFASALSKPAHKFIARKLMANAFTAKQLLPVSNWPAYAYCLTSYIREGYDLRAVLPSIDIPISVIVGLRSEMYPVGGQLRIADYAPNAEVIRFDRSGHTPLIDQPIKFSQELMRFASA